MRTLARTASRFGRSALVVGGCGVAAGAFALSASSDAAACHGHHNHGGSSDSATSRIEKLERQVASLTDLLKEQFNVSMTTGQGKAVFSWDRALTAAFPDGAKPHEKNMHGGFNEDPKTGVVYTGIPGYGLCTISPDLKTWSLLGSDERLKANIHGIVVFEHDGVTSIAVTQNEDQRVLIIGLDGTVKQQLDMPKGGEFNFAEANAYYSKRPKQQCPWETGARAPFAPVFACTDVTYYNGKLYVVTGYSDGDFVLTASLDTKSNAAWGPIAWGGKGDGAAQFQTAHGVFAHDDSIFVANREAHEVLEFTPEGHLVRSLPDLPAGARICNVARAEEDDMFIFNALAPIAHCPGRAASIYAHSGERLLSEIQPGELGIPVLKHLHHVWPHYVVEADGTKQLYILCHGWSAGKFAVLKHEPKGEPSVVKTWDLRPGKKGFN